MTSYRSLKGDRRGIRVNPMSFDPDDYFADPGFWLEPDFLLTTLVSMLANKMDSQVGITLLVHGTLITGALVSESEYLDRMDGLFKETATNALITPTKEELKFFEEALRFETQYEDIYPGDDDTDDGPGPKDEVGSLRHLHLKDPVIVYPGAALSFVDSPLPIMRIKLASVDGWLIGRMNLVGPDDLSDIPDNGIRH